MTKDQVLQRTPVSSGPHAANLTSQRPARALIVGLSDEVYERWGQPAKVDSREKNALLALLNSPLRREALDHASDASSDTDVVMRLRKVHGLEIPSERVEYLDRKGQYCQACIYRLTARDRILVHAWLGLHFTWDSVAQSISDECERALAFHQRRPKGSLA